MQTTSFEIKNGQIVKITARPIDMKNADELREYASWQAGKARNRKPREKKNGQEVQQIPKA